MIRSVINLFQVCYQVHHHVHRADFDRVDSVNELLDLLKGGTVGGVLRATSPDQLRKDKWDKRQQKRGVREISCDLHQSGEWIH